MSKYLLGIDVGSTIAKASIFDTDGNEITSFGQKAVILTPKPGYYERDMNEIWDSCVNAIKTCIEKSGIDSADIIGISMTGHGNGLHLVDKDGKPVRNAIEGADSRAASYNEKWINDGTFDKIHPFTMQALWPAISSCVFAWMLDNEPESIEKAKWCFDAKDYVRFMLTDVANVEVTNFSGTGLVNVKEQKIDKDVLDMMGLGKIFGIIPPMVKSTDVCGGVTEKVASLTGLKEGTPVVAGIYDIDAAAVSTGVIDETKMNVIAGTWCNNQYVSQEPIADKEFFSTTVFSNDGYYLMLEGSPTSASNLEWFVSEMLQTERKLADENGTSVFDICNGAVKDTQPEDSDIVFIPFIYGSNAGPKAKSAFIGIQGWHKREHIIRAVYEGICFSHRWHVEKLMAYRDKPEAMRFAGGASRSKVWLQMFADVLQTPIEVTKADELGTLGASICAGVGIGEFASFDECCANMVHIERRVEPDKEKFDVYTKKFLRYKKAIKSLDGFWE